MHGTPPPVECGKHSKHWICIDKSQNPAYFLCGNLCGFMLVGEIPQTPWNCKNRLKRIFADSIKAHSPRMELLCCATQNAALSFSLRNMKSAKVRVANGG